MFIVDNYQSGSQVQQFYPDSLIKSVSLLQHKSYQPLLKFYHHILQGQKLH